MGWGKTEWKTKRGEAERSAEYDNLDKKIKVIKADLIVMHLIEFKMQQESLLKWIHNIYKYHNLVGIPFAGLQAIATVKTETEASISFSIERIASAKYIFNTDEVTISQGSINVSINPSIIEAFTKEALHWIDTKFRVSYI